jgi:hypothetical protein
VKTFSNGVLNPAPVCAPSCDAKFPARFFYYFRIAYSFIKEISYRSFFNKIKISEIGSGEVMEGIYEWENGK